MAYGLLNDRESSRIRGKISVSKDGPYLVSGGIPLSKRTIGIDAAGYSCEWREGEKYPPRENYALCRCGHSKTEPFCDETHLRMNFDGTETASRQPYLDQARKILGPALEIWPITTYLLALDIDCPREPDVR